MVDYLYKRYWNNDFKLNTIFDIWQTEANAKNDKINQSTKESEYLTSKDEIKEALIDLASRAYSGDEFIELLVSLAISFKIDINSKNTKEVLGIYGISDTKLAQKKAKAFYNKYGLAKRNERKKEARETAANIAVENITKMVYELDSKEEKQNILDTIAGLEVLADIGDQDAKDTIEGLKLLLD